MKAGGTDAGGQTEMFHNCRKLNSRCRDLVFGLGDGGAVI